MTKTIVFDFDGTLADTFTILLEITNELSHEFGYAQVSAKQVAQLEGLSAREILKVAGISVWQIPFLLRRFKLAFRHKTDEVQLFPDIANMLQTLKYAGYKLGIVSSNSVDNIYTVLHQHQVDHLFSFVRSSSLFGKSRAIAAALRAHHVHWTEAIYVGDEVRDIDAARRSKIPVIAVTWGFNQASTLTQKQPDYVVDKPQEILQLLVKKKTSNADRP
jgi:HAD superfamily hydrolase (TIGR01549 family)